MKRHLMPETRVKRVGEAAVTGEDGWTFAPPAEHIHRFEPGLEYALETRGLSVVTGCRIDGDRIEFSRLEKHQVMALNETVELEGISMLFVLIAGHASLLRWPITGFKPGTSLIQDGEALYVR